ncbi:peptidase M16, partial [candidate division KSB3 bacterium]|nr:peptidase M16 [candidate division KSB3 bacterium]MBD3323613.1 peptidase M16 [candidate division KSB3 bacterium]
DDDPQKRLRVLGKYLAAFDSQEVNSDIALQPRFDQPRQITIPYDASNDEETDHKSMVTVNWILTEARTPEMTLALLMLNQILIGTPASPLRKALIDSGLGEDLAGHGLDDELRQIIFSTGLKGIKAENAPKIEELILSTLTALVQEGIDPDMIEAAVNTTEFSLREQNTGSFPRGLALMFVALSSWLYGDDPIAPLAFEAPLQAIKSRIASGAPYFEPLIQRYLVENPHRTRVLLVPDPDLKQHQQAEEQHRLAQVRAAMSAAEITHIIEQTQELKRLQETPDPPEALATIPTLTLDDLEKTNKSLPLALDTEGHTQILYHDLFTNGIVYVDLGLDLHALPQDLLPYVPLFGKAFVKMGTETEDFVKLSQRIGRKTGGIWPTLFNATVKEAEVSAAWLFLRGKATVAQADDLLDIFRDVLLTVKLDNPERFKQMVLESKARKESSLIPAGHQVVRTRLGAHFNESGWVSEQTGGISSLFFIRHLAREVEQNWPAVLEKLEAIRRILINRHALLCNVTLDQDNWQQFRPKLSRLLEALPTDPVNRQDWTFQPLPEREGLTIPAQVNYVGKGANLYDFGYTFHGSALVATHYLRTSWLWDKIRVQGGAYGGFCSFNRRSGLFNYLSYRDPNLLKTLENYDQAAEFLRHAELSQEELTKSIIGVIGQIDDYQLPDAKGYTSMARYLVGDTEEMLQRMRDEVLATTASDIKAFAEMLQQVREHGLVVVMGAQEALEQVNQNQKDWLTMLKVL